MINYEAIAEGKEEKIQGQKLDRGEGGGIPLKRSVLNANHRGYRCLSGLIGFRRPNSAYIGLGCFRRGPAYGPAYGLSAGLPAAWPVGNTEGTEFKVGWMRGTGIGPIKLSSWEH